MSNPNWEVFKRPEPSSRLTPAQKREIEILKECGTITVSGGQKERVLESLWRKGIVERNNDVYSLK